MNRINVKKQIAKRLKHIAGKAVLYLVGSAVAVFAVWATFWILHIIFDS